jgi:hypothetical protein
MDNQESNRITNAFSNNSKKNDSKQNGLKENIERCKKILLSSPLIPLFSIKDIIGGAVGTVIPWTILLIIVGFIIII